MGRLAVLIGCIAGLGSAATQAKAQAPPYYCRYSYYANIYVCQYYSNYYNQFNYGYPYYEHGYAYPSYGYGHPYVEGAAPSGAVPSGTTPSFTLTTPPAAIAHPGMPAPPTATSHPAMTPIEPNPRVSTVPPPTPPMAIGR